MPTDSLWLSIGLAGQACFVAGLLVYLRNLSFGRKPEMEV